MTLRDFEEVFDHIGGFGPYQWIIFGFICLFNCFYTTIYFGQIFMVLTPPHWCKLSPELNQILRAHLGPNATESDIKNYTIPTTGDSLGYESCSRFDINVTQLLSSSHDTLVPYDWPLIDCDNGWEYDFSSYYPTITSQLNWVCTEDWKPAFAQTSFFVGCMIGVPLFGWLADYYGRLPLIVVTNMIGGIFGVASAFSSSFLVFCILRFCVGLSFDSNYYIIYTLGIEYVSAAHRSFIANVPVMIFLSGSMAVMPWIAYYLHDWTTFTIVIYAPMIICLIVPFLIPESARWLIGKGKTEKVLHIVEKAAIFNKKELSDSFKSDFKEYINNEKLAMTSKAVTWLDLLKTPTLRKRFLALCCLWLGISLAYDGFLRNSENLGSNFFVTFTILGIVELPADLLTIFSMEWMGRKNTVFTTTVSCGFLSIASIFLDQNDKLAILIAAIVGRFLITMSMNVSMQYVMEVLPTSGRAQGSGAIHTLGFVTIFVSPYIVYLSKLRYWIPYAAFGIISILGGLSALLLPETLGENLPDSLEDGERFFNSQPMFYNPWLKKKVSQNNEKEDKLTNSNTEMEIKNC